MSKKVFITGITGQDGAYLAKLLISKGYIVFGALRKSSSINDWRLKTLGVFDKINFVQFDYFNLPNIIKTIESLAILIGICLILDGFMVVSCQRPFTNDIAKFGRRFSMDV